MKCIFFSLTWVIFFLFKNYHFATEFRGRVDIFFFAIFDSDIFLLLRLGKVFLASTYINHIVDPQNALIIR